MITVTNEPGNNAIFNFPDGTYCLIGSAIMPDNNIVTFLTNNTISIIGIHTVDTDQFDIVIKTECLNFKCHNQISAKTRIISGCERKVYFTD
jgi:putative lipase involved disintegration of autophagic bodies